MGDWNIIECGFNTADETLNFGTRQFAQGDNLYEACTLASIRDSNPCGSITNLEAIINNGKVIFSIDETIKIFTDSLCNELQLSLTFDSTIDAFCITTDGSFLFICLRNGVVHCIDTVHENSIVSSKCIEDNNNLDDVFFVKAFVECRANALSILLVVNNGKIFRMTLKLEAEKSNEGDAEVAESQLIIDLDRHVKNVAFDGSILLLNGSKMSAYDISNEDSTCFDCLELKQMFCCNKGMFIAIDEQGNLIKICGRTLLVVCISDEVQFESFAYVPSCSSESQIVAITKPDELGKSCIQSFTYPGLSLLFSLKVTAASYLIYPQNIHDEYMYISLIKSDDIIEELRILQIIDTAPENRLKRLLCRQKFDEALLFAKAFNLGVTEIQKAKAQFIVDKSTCNKTDIRDLLDILNTIDDVYFKVKCCLDVFTSCENLEDVYNVLNYGCFCVPTYDVSQDVNELLKIISEMMFRFETHTLIRKQCNYDVDWTEFSECDLLESVYSSLQRHNIEAALIIYNRLDLTNTSKLDEQKIEIILNLLNNLALPSCMSFLLSFFPLTLARLPNTLHLFVKWLKQKLFAIEQNYNEKFPQIADEFINIFTRVLKLNNVTNLSFRQQSVSNKDAVDDLSDLMRALKTMKILKETYCIVVPLKKYYKNSRSLINTLLLVDLKDEIYQQFLNDFLCNFILECHFEPDEIFLEEIRDLVKYQECFWIKIVPSILNCINAVEIKLNAIITVLVNADMPWCQTIRDVARKALDYNHEYVETIKGYIKAEPNQIVLRRPKYNFSSKDIDKSQTFGFIIGRIIYCNEPTLVEDAFQLCKDAEQKDWVTIRLIDNFVRSGKYSEALNVLDNSNSNKIADYCNSIITMLESLDQFEVHQKAMDNYSAVLNSIYARWKSNTNGRNQMGVEESFDTWKRYFETKEKFCKTIKLDDMTLPTKRNNLLDSILSDCAQKFFERELSVEEVLKSCKLISRCFNESEGFVIIKFCQKLDDVEFIPKFGEAMILHECESRNLCLMATLLMKSVNSWNLDKTKYNESFDDKSILMQENTSENTYSFRLKLAEQLATKAILKSDVNEVASCVEVYNWAMSTFFSRNTYDLDSKCTFKRSGLEILNPVFRSMQSFRFIFNTFTSFIVGRRQPNMKYLTYFDDEISQISPDQLIQQIEQFPIIIQNLLMEGHCVTAAKLITTFKNGLLNSCDSLPNVYEQINSILINKCIPLALQKIFAANYIDTNSAYILLTNYNSKYGLKEIQRCLAQNKQNIQKFSTIAKLALRILNYHKINTNRRVYEVIILRCKWWTIIENCQLSKKEFFTLTNDELVEKLIDHHHLNLESLTEFCQDFCLEMQTSYGNYLKALLTKWVPNYLQAEDEIGRTKIVMKNGGDDLFEKCKAVIEVIENKESLDSFINNFYSMINFYHYEVFICVFKILRFLNKSIECTKKLMLLTFLKSYKRVKTASNAELEEWYSAFPDSQNIDPLSHWRLPFTLTLFTNDVWKIIRPEINLNTYKIWFNAVQILDRTLNKDDICSFVVKEVVSSGDLKKNDTEVWTLHSTHENLFEEIDKCVQNITDYEKATSAIYHLMTQTSKGIDQVTAAKLCLKYATQFKEQSAEPDPSILKAFKKVMYKYLHISGSHILHKYQLAVDKYIKMLPQSHDLITALYMDERILKRESEFLVNFPDINRAVDELGKLIEMNVQEKREQLLDTFLSDATALNLNSSSWYLKPLEMNNSGEDATANNLKRASYICESGDLSYWQNYLSEKGCNDAVDDNKNLNFKANCMKCLCAISDPSSIERLTRMPYDDFLNHIDKLFLLSDLESLGVSISVEKLDKHNKLSLLKRLSQDAHNPLTVKIMFTICSTYNVFDLRHWEVIINSSIKLNLTIPSIKNKKFYVDAWQTIVDHSFATASRKEEEVYNLFLENILLLQSCPVLFSLNFEKAFKHCCEHQRLEFSAIILQYLHEEDRVDYAKEILKYNKTDLILSIEKLSLNGIWGSAYVIKLLINE